MFLKLVIPIPTGTTFNLYVLKNSVVSCAFRYNECLVKMKVGVHIFYGTIHLALIKVQSEIMAGKWDILLNV
jgi:hypothetical protein